MTLQASGAITMTEIDTEFGLGTNLGAYRGETYWLDDGTSGTFSAGAIAMSDFYSTRVDEPKDFTYIDTLTATSTAGVSFGTESPSRLIVVAICSTRNNNHTVTSATIGGVAATIAVQTSKGGNSINPTAAIIYAEVPTGASGTVAITFSAAPSSVRAAVYRLVGCTAVIPSDTTTDTTGSNALNLNIPAGTGFAVAASTQVSGGDQTWTGLTERYEVSSNSTRHEIADSNGFIAEETNRSISASNDNTSNGLSVSAVWG